MTPEQLRALEKMTGGELPDIPDDPQSRALQKMVGAAPEDRSTQFMLKGLTFGLSPRIAAAMETGQFSGPEYEAARDREWELDDAYAKAYPVSAAGYEIAGALPTMLVPGLGGARVAQAAARGFQVADGLSRSQRIMRALGMGRNLASAGHEAGLLGAKSAALYGGLSSRDDTAEGRLMDAAQYAPFGYLFGRGTNMALRPLVGVADEASDAITTGSVPSYGARSTLLRNMERDGVSVDDIRDAIRPDMGRRRAMPGAIDDAIRAPTNAAGRAAYAAAMRDAGSTLADSTLDAHASAARRMFADANTIPMSIDEAATMAGSRGRNMRWNRRATMAQAGDGATDIIDAIEGRQENIIPTVRSWLTRRLAGPDFIARRDALRARHRDIANTAYAAARRSETPFDISGPLREAYVTLPQRGGDARSAMGEALRIMRGVPMADGRFERHTLDTYIQSRAQLNNFIGDLRRAGKYDAVDNIMDLKRKMDEIVRSSNPEWWEANRLFADGRGIQGAMEDAAKVKLVGNDDASQEIINRVSTLRSEVNRLSAIRSPSPSQAERLEAAQAMLEAYESGFPKVLHGELNRLGDYHDLAKLFTKGGVDGAGGPRATIRAMLSEDDAETFLGLVDRARTASSSYRDLGGSQTTPLREAIDEMNVENKISGAAAALGYLTNPTKIFQDIGARIGRRYSEQRNAVLGDYYSRMTDDPAAFYAMLDELANHRATRSPLFAREGYNAYSAPAISGGAFSAPFVEDWERDEYR